MSFSVGKAYFLCILPKITGLTSFILPVSLDTEAIYTLFERSCEIGNDCHSNSVRVAVRLDYLVMTPVVGQLNSQEGNQEHGFSSYNRQRNEALVRAYRSHHQRDGAYRAR